MKILAILTVLTFTISNANAQLLKKIKQKAEEAVTKKADKPAAEKQSTDDVTKDDTGNSSPVAAIANTAVPTLKVYSKFDFVPGEKVVRFEDFSDVAVGDFPGKWYTNGSGEVVTIEGREGKWLMLQQSAEFFMDQLLQLPDNFTIQFDLLTTLPFNWSSGVIDFKLQDVIDLARYRKGDNGSENSTFNFNTTSFSFDLHPGVVNTSNYNSKGYGHYRTATTNENINLEEIFMPVPEKNLLKVSVWRQKQRIRIYLNENKMVDLPRILPEDMKPNLFTIRTGRYEADDHYFISNLRIAVGNPDTRNKLITDGKLVTTGILFDVNSDQIKPESYGVLKEIAGILKENSSGRVKITGHTDSDGDAAKNLELSKKRAAAVKNSLVKDFNIPANNLETDGKGEAAPAVPNTDAASKANNRRVEFTTIK